ncbi:hypothetical protein K0U91_08640 [Chryseobacterium chendengshani]|uniref:hypothetical protein n=1 Tax=Chryseobacterium sp. LJ668 TaxID=2864040 RepID=UPI001C68F8FB|nr:hypothetical protein [Chryseobacterium sp. LJ668]MBW8524825.1 hypothetical protein [Chryseobacterium sp. LJ668]QYK15156.1 hypothetical protein K0U91_08640 [Chryseobacterium sp. LJ668]
MKTLISILILSFLVSCSDKEIVKEIDQKEKYSFDNILSYNNEDTIFIKSQFADCGEWGGHEELIKIYRLEKQIELSYTKFGADCGIRDSLGSIIQVKKLNKKISLSSSQQLMLMNYINNLIKLKFVDEEMSNYGNFFYLNNTKVDLKLAHYGNQPLLLANYNTLIFALALQKVKIDNY